jgi:hypothetical protein
VFQTRTTDGVTGFRNRTAEGELSGVRWEDICFEDKILTPKRSIVKQRISKVKTEASKKEHPAGRCADRKIAGLASGDSLCPRQRHPIQTHVFLEERLCRLSLCGHRMETGVTEFDRVFVDHPPNCVGAL